jgi:dolichol-phosphate mannosyltransferase
MLHKCLLAIPIYNEKAHVERVLAAARRHCRELLVIDDGSTDGTAEVLERLGGIRVLTHAQNRGYGKSLADAFAYALQHGYRWLITMDCDEQHEPAQIPQFLEAIARDEADLISGTRYPAGFDTGVAAPADRRAINRHITTLLNDTFGLSITDAFCGFKAYRMLSARQFHITVPGYAMPIQLWVQAACAGLQVTEIPVRLIYNDPTRHFGGALDDPAVRLQHYLAVFEAELARCTAQRGRCFSFGLPNAPGRASAESGTGP